MINFEAKFITIICSLLILGAYASAATDLPRIGFVFPAGGQQGTSFEIKVGGENIYGATSANISGFESPAVFSQIAPQIKESVDYIVSYKQDYFTRTKPSTIIRLSDDGMYTIIRG